MENSLTLMLHYKIAMLSHRLITYKIDRKF